MSDQKKLTDAGNAGTQEADDRLEKAPDVNTVRNATGRDTQTAFDSNPNIWQSEQGMFAITDGSETIAKQSARADKDKSPQTETADNRFQSATLMALEAAKNPVMQPVALARQYI